MDLPMAGGLEPDLYSSFQYKPFYDSMIYNAFVLKNALLSVSFHSLCLGMKQGKKVNLKTHSGCEPGLTQMNRAGTLPCPVPAVLSQTHFQHHSYFGAVLL